MFKVGQIVRFKTVDELKKDFNVREDSPYILTASTRFTFVQKMAELCGKQFKITKIEEDGKILGHGTTWSVSDDMLTAIDFKVGDKVRIRDWEDMERDFVIDSDGDIDIRVPEMDIDTYFFWTDKDECGREYIIKTIDGSYAIMENGSRYCFAELDLVERKGEELVMTEQFKVGDLVKIKSLEKLEADCEECVHDDYRFVRRNGENIHFVEAMSHLCGKRFTITDIEENGDVKGHGTSWFINEKFVEKDEFKVGDIVKFKSWEELESQCEFKKSNGDLVFEETDYHFAVGMKHLCGTEFKITNIDYDGEIYGYKGSDRWFVSGHFIKLIEKFSEEKPEETIFKVGDVVQIKSKEEIEKFEDENGDVQFGWNDRMDALCGKVFKVTKITDGGYIYGHGSIWSISADMLKKLDIIGDLSVLESEEKEEVVPEPQKESVYAKYEYGVQYYYLDENGECDDYQCDKDSTDEQLYEIGNAYSSREAAETASRKLSLLRRLERYAEEVNDAEFDLNDYSQAKYRIIARKGELDIMYGFANHIGCVSFDSSEKAEKALELFKSELEELYL